MGVAQGSLPRLAGCPPDRDDLNQWADAKGEEDLAAYRNQKNGHSIDGLVTNLGLDGK